MTLAKEKKKELIGGYKVHEKDTGSPNVQIALLTERINSLSGHFKTHKKDIELMKKFVEKVRKAD